MEVFGLLKQKRKLEIDVLDSEELVRACTRLRRKPYVFIHAP
jgi:hypothetical protein